MAALVNGLPLVVVPISADQPDNAARCADLGVGTVVEAGRLTPDAVRSAVRAVLSDGKYRRNAEHVREEIAALPGPDDAAKLLELLAAHHLGVGAYR
jgi:UDP:flavonoid glycosyltransferase YjiC (YdhE family)